MNSSLRKLSLAEPSSDTVAHPIRPFAASGKIGNPRLAKRIFESGLPAHLKHTAGVMALFWAREDGSGIYPSREYLAHLTGKNPRQLTRDFSALIRFGVLVKVTPRSGGRGRTTVYRLDGDALPARPHWTPKPRHGCPPLSDRNIGTDAQVSPAKGGHQKQKTWTSEARNVDMDVHRSVLRDQQEEVQVRTTAASPPRTWTEEKAREPNGDNQAVIDKLAFLTLKEHVFATGVKVEPNYSDFVDLVKCRCAENHIDIGNHPDVAHNAVHQACDRALHWLAWARAAGRLPRHAPSEVIPVAAGEAPVAVAAR
jgi:hypothetical protein